MLHKAYAMSQYLLNNLILHNKGMVGFVLTKLTAFRKLL